jgi:uncharacterized protein YhfF
MEVGRSAPTLGADATACSARATGWKSNAIRPSGDHHLSGNALVTSEADATVPDLAECATSDEATRKVLPMSALPPVEALMAELARHGITLPPGPVHADGYGDSAASSDELIALIRSGHKRAGTGLLWAYQLSGDHIGQVGDIEIVVDHRHRPVLVTRIVQAEIIAFDAVTAEYAAIEGEGDGSLGYWREAHWRYFSRECARIGREPAASMPVICNVFEVLAVVPAPLSLNPP